ncbi:hypothetical protein FA13DRAFT_857750 [Coprinellus micaceus]|uniref:NACHT domain-containing protein n=1 Tax=Coprinellus micaceus TaxID=71717 RepID=A0A4Y7T2N6_COPMI|nr:hypothetical protein FA13DRAFT_857750 [Coprinellus micaceus]
MSAHRPMDGAQPAPSPRVQEFNLTTVARDYHDHRTISYDNRVTIGSSSHPRPLDRLLGHVCHGALHDSEERGGDAPKCYPETRTAVQRDVMSWIGYGEQDEAPSKILWLSGPAGSGKTAIAGTIADECYKQGLLAASFFFSAFATSINRHSKNLLIPTLVYRLIQHESIVGLKGEALAVIERDPIVFERHLDQQLEELVLKPLRKVAGRSDHCHWPKVIVIDGLDECQGDEQTSGSDAQKQILSAFYRACRDPAFPFRIIIASRPEPVIRHFFSNSPNLSLNIFLDDKYDPDADIRLYLEAMLSDIRRRFNIPSTWAAKEVVDRLVKEASGQFIYPATIIRFLDNPQLGAPQQQLTRLLEWRRLDNSKPFAPLDALYQRILRTSPDPVLAVKWLLFINRQTSTNGLGAWYIRALESYSGELDYVLGSLTSLVRLVDDEGEPEFHFYHKSLIDFLGDPHRSSNLHLNEESLIRFARDQYYQVLQARGPQSNPDLSAAASTRAWTFLETFCWCLPVGYIDPRRRYTSADVKWWLVNLKGSDLDTYIPTMFSSIHEECKWYRCLPSCAVWRKGVLRYCREKGWRVPAATELLWDRFKKRGFYGSLSPLTA